MIDYNQQRVNYDSVRISLYTCVPFLNHSLHKIKASLILITIIQIPF